MEVIKRKENNMSFLCNNCNKTSKPKTRQNRITIEKRERTYYNIIITHKAVKKERFLQFENKDQNILDNLNKLGWKVVHERFSKGTEIIKEKILCEDCYRKLGEKNEKS